MTLFINNLIILNGYASYREYCSWWETMNQSLLLLSRTITEAFIKAINTTTGIQYLLLAGIKRVRCRWSIYRTVGIGFSILPFYCLAGFQCWAVIKYSSTLVSWKITVWYSGCISAFMGFPWSVRDTALRFTRDSIISRPAIGTVSTSIS